MESIRIQAKFVVVSPEMILHPGQVVVRHGRVVELCGSTKSKADVDLGDGVLLPGLVNSHTHLEFSDLEKPFPAGDSFPVWIRAVVEHRIANPCSRAQRLKTIQRGAEECFQSGTALIADIVTQPWHWQDSASLTADTNPGRNELGTTRTAIPAAAWAEHLGTLAGPRFFQFPELIGLSQERLADTVAWARAVLNETSSSSQAVCKVGISPHSPYSTRYPDIARACDSFAKKVTFAMHLAESLDEREWAVDGTGAFRSTFEQLGIVLPGQRLQMMEAIGILALQERSLLVHGNYLTEPEMDAVAAAGNTSVVYCPRTHKHFGHSPYPLQQLKKRGIRVVLGTDSRASNPDLDIWAELQTARCQHPELSDQDALAAVTTEAAAALGCEQDFGSLRVGAFAHMNIVSAKSTYQPQTLLEQLTSNSLHLIPLCGNS